MNRSHGLLLAGFVLATGCRETKQPADALRAADPIVLRKVGFATPESVFHDPLSDVYLISNINGSPLATDDNGFISVVSANGQDLTLKGIDGAADSITLNAPKGMAAIGEFFYVTDINTIRRFDRRTGGPRGDIPIRGATFLNDMVAGDDGFLYFTDSGLKAGPDGLVPSGTDAVYRLTPGGTLDTLARGDELGRPNGIALAGDSVWVVGGASGELYRVAGGHKTDVIKLPKGGLDGLVIFSGEAFVSSWDGQSIFRGKLGGPFEEMLTGLPAPADIGHDLWRNRLLIPLFNDNEVRIVPLVPW